MLLLLLFLFTQVCLQEPAAPGEPVLGVRFMQSIQLSCCTALSEIELTPKTATRSQFHQLSESVPEFALACLGRAVLLQNVLFALDPIKASQLFSPPHIPLREFQEFELKSSREYYDICSANRLEGHMTLAAPRTG